MESGLVGVDLFAKTLQVTDSDVFRTMKNVPSLVKFNSVLYLFYLAMIGGIVVKGKQFYTEYK